MTDRERFAEVLTRHGFTHDAEDVRVYPSVENLGATMQSEGWWRGSVCATFTTYADGSRVTGVRLHPDGDELSAEELDKELSK